MSIAINSQVKSIQEALMRIIRTSGSSTSMIKAPPGSGKTTLLCQIAIEARKHNLRIAIAAQTNNQADEVCERISLAGQQVIRFVSSKDAGLTSTDPNITIMDKLLSFAGPGIVVGTSAKWGFASGFQDFDLLFIEEAWQLSHADFLMFGNRVGEKVIICGDPGQISPTVTIPTTRWATHAKGPHLPAPVVLSSLVRAENTFELPATRRLPSDTTELVKNFYDFDFSSTALKGERKITPQKLNKASEISKALDHFHNSSFIGLTIKTPKNGPPQEKDNEMIRMAVRTAEELVKSKAKILIDGKESIITPSDIGIVSTHRIMVNSISLNLPTGLKGEIKVDTPERWQGLERKAMIAIHPLSGTIKPSSFDLETGRLCVMASRHKAGLIILSRDHVGHTLENCYPAADHPFSASDSNGKGLYQHERFWGSILKIDKIISIDEEMVA